MALPFSPARALNPLYDPLEQCQLLRSRAGGIQV